MLPVTPTSEGIQNAAQFSVSICALPLHSPKADAIMPAILAGVRLDSTTCHKLQIELLHAHP